MILFLKVALINANSQNSIKTELHSAENQAAENIEIILKLFQIPLEKEQNFTIAYFRNKNSQNSTSKKIGLFGPNQNFIQEITKVVNELDQSNDVDIQIQNVEILDINGDSQNDFILNVIQNTQNYDEVLNSYFFIKTENKFKQSKYSFIKDNYEIHLPYIKVYSPLIQYKDPYFSQENSTKWLDFYTFKDGELTLSNNQQKSYFKKKLKASEEKLKELIVKVEIHNPQLSQIEESQLILQELLEDILNKKILIKRIKRIIDEIN